MENSNKEKSRTISFFDLVFVIAKRWKMIFFTSFGGAVFILVYALISLKMSPEKSLLPNLYKPNVIILFQEEEGGLSSMLSGGSDLLSLMGGSMDGGSSKSDLAKILLKSNRLLDSIIDEYSNDRIFKEFESSDYPRQSARLFLIEKTSAEVNAEDGTMSISFEHYDPRFAEKIVLRMVDLLEVEYKKLSKARAEESVSFLDDSILKAEVEMNEKLKELTAFQNKHRVIDPLKQLEIKSEAIASLEHQIIQKRLKIEEIAQYKGYSDPQVKQAQKEVKNLERALQMQLEGKGIDSEYNIPISQLLDVGPEYNKLKEELDGLRQLYINLKVQQQAKQMELGNTASTFQVIQKPEYFASLGPGERPEEMPQKSGPSRGKLCILFTFAIFFLAVLAAFILEFLEQVKQDPEEGQKLEAIKAQLPSLKRKKKN